MARVLTSMELHHVGAIVRHASPFTELAVPVSEERMGGELRDKWVAPLYMHLLGGHDAYAIQTELAPLRDDIDPSVVTTLLAYFDWRPRLVGAWLAALREMTEFDDHIGRLLVRSDVCYAGKGYCLALARFNTVRSREYLVSYLDYYLGRPDLWFEQYEAMGALAYFDRRNGRQDVAKVRDAWERFSHGRSTDLESMGARFGMRVRRVEALSALLWPGS